jgi:hypothetical protein
MYSTKDSDCTYSLTGNVWVGATDRKVEGTFQWVVGNGDKIAVSWYPGQPNNYGGQDCLSLSNRAQFRDDSCYDGLYFVCEKQQQIWNLKVQYLLHGHGSHMWIFRKLYYFMLSINLVLNVQCLNWLQNLQFISKFSHLYFHLILPVVFINLITFILYYVRKLPCKSDFFRFINSYILMKQNSFKNFYMRRTNHLLWPLIQHLDISTMFYRSTATSSIHISIIYTPVNLKLKTSQNHLLQLHTWTFC